MSFMFIGLHVFLEYNVLKSHHIMLNVFINFHWIENPPLFIALHISQLITFYFPRLNKFLFFKRLDLSHKNRKKEAPST